VYSSSQGCHTATGTHIPHGITVLPATRQRWHSHSYPSRSWYSIKRPRRDARLSCPYWTSDAVDYNHITTMTNSIASRYSSWALHMPLPVTSSSRLMATIIIAHSRPNISTPPVLKKLAISMCSSRQVTKGRRMYFVFFLWLALLLQTRHSRRQ